MKGGDTDCTAKSTYERSNKRQTKYVMSLGNHFGMKLTRKNE